MEEEIKDGYFTDDCNSKNTDLIDYIENQKEVELAEFEIMYQQDFEDINANFSNDEKPENDCIIMSQNASFSSEEEPDQFLQSTK